VRQKKIDSIEGKIEKSFFDRLKSNFYYSKQTDLKEEFFITTEEVDKVRRENWKELFPALVDAFNLHKYI